MLIPSRKFLLSCNVHIFTDVQGLECEDPLGPLFCLAYHTTTIKIQNSFQHLKKRALMLILPLCSPTFSPSLTPGNLLPVRPRCNFAFSILPYHFESGFFDLVTLGD